MLKLLKTKNSVFRPSLTSEKHGKFLSEAQAEYFNFFRFEIVSQFFTNRAIISSSLTQTANARTTKKNVLLFTFFCLLFHSKNGLHTQSLREEIQCFSSKNYDMNPPVFVFGDLSFLPSIFYYVSQMLSPS